MARERKKPEGSFIERAKNEIENEDTLLTNRAYELGRIRGRKEQQEIDIEKAKKSFNAACGWLSVYPWYQGVFEEFVKALEK